MKIINHLFEKTAEDDIGLRFHPSPHFSDNFTGKPHLIVVHYTAGASLESSVNWLSDPRAKASAHLVIGKNGDIVQLVPFNKKAWHAGKSSWKGKSNINKYSIGIELDNAGKLIKRADGYYTGFNKKISDHNVVLAKHKFNNDEEAWEAYTQEQINSFIEVCNVLLQTFPITEIIGHEDVAPDRKTDPGPAFPLKSLEESILYGRKDMDTVENINETMVVTAPYLNIRSLPDVQSVKINNPLKSGTVLKVHKTQKDWSLVSTTIKGWVSNKWLKPL